ncbi:hypothetical protein CANCADRAFT_24941, partial [Tortispora caseinolytica NRRL Y-17796]
MYRYLEVGNSFRLANDIFGFDGWSSQILQLSTEHVEQVKSNYIIVSTAVVRIILRDGTTREDTGVGICENVRSFGTAFDKSRKSAISDGYKRCFKQFGDSL